MLPNADSDWLFPSKTYTDQPRHKGGLGNSIILAIHKNVGVRMSTHQFRALADAFILGANPHAIEDLRLVLGHTTFDTSMRFYASSAPKGAVARLCEGDHDGAPAHPAPRWCEVRDSRELLADAIALFEMGSTGRGYAHGRVAVRDAALLGLLATHGPRIRSVGAMEMRSDHVATFCKAFIEEWNRAQAEVSVGAEGARRDLQGVQRKLDNLVDAIAEGVRAPGVQRKLEELEARGEQLKAALQGQSAVAPVLHPNLAEVYARRAAVLRDAIEGRNDPEVLEAARALVDKVIVSPGQGPDDPPEIELVGHLVGILRAGGAVLATEDAAVGDALKASTSGSVEGGARGQSPSILHRQAHGPPVSGPLVR